MYDYLTGFAEYRLYNKNSKDPNIDPWGTI